MARAVGASTSQGAGDTSAVQAASGGRRRRQRQQQRRPDRGRHGDVWWRRGRERTAARNRPAGERNARGGREERACLSRARGAIDRRGRVRSGGRRRRDATRRRQGKWGRRQRERRDDERAREREREREGAVVDWKKEREERGEREEGEREREAETRRVGASARRRVGGGRKWLARAWRDKHQLAGHDGNNRETQRHRLTHSHTHTLSHSQTNTMDAPSPAGPRPSAIPRPPSRLPVLRSAASQPQLRSPASSDQLRKKPSASALTKPKPQAAPRPALSKQPSRTSLARPPAPGGTAATARVPLSLTTPRNPANSAHAPSSACGARRLQEARQPRRLHQEDCVVGKDVCYRRRRRRRRRRHLSEHRRRWPGLPGRLPLRIACILKTGLPTTRSTNMLLTTPTRSLRSASRASPCPTGPSRRWRKSPPLARQGAPPIELLQCRQLDAATTAPDLVLGEPPPSHERRDAKGSLDPTPRAGKTARQSNRQRNPPSHCYAHANQTIIHDASGKPDQEAARCTNQHQPARQNAPLVDCQNGLCEDTKAASVADFGFRSSHFTTALQCRVSARR